MKKIFKVWNQAYKAAYILADDHVDALNVCAAKRFLRRATLFRKYEEITENAIADFPELEAFLTQEESGVLIHGEAGWEVT